MLRIMAGMDPKDCIALFGISLCKARFTGGSRHPEGHLCSEAVAVLVADYGSGMFLLADAVRAVFTSLSAGPPAGGELRGMDGFAGDDAFCVMFPSFVLRPSYILAGMDQKDSCTVHPCRGAEAYSHGLLFQRP